MIRYRNEFFVEPEFIFKLLYGFVAMQLGSIAYEKKKEIEESHRGFIFIALSMISIGGFLGTKLLIERIHFFVKVQFLTQLFGVVFAISALVAGIYFENQIKKFMKTILGRLLGIISKSSLEIYLIQFPIIAYCRSLPFPINLLLILICTILVAFVIHRISELVYRKLVRVTK